MQDIILEYYSKMALADDKIRGFLDNEVGKLSYVLHQMNSDQDIKLEDAIKKALSPRARAEFAQNISSNYTVLQWVLFFSQHWAGKEVLANEVSVTSDSRTYLCSVTVPSDWKIEYYDPTYDSINIISPEGEFEITGVYNQKNGFVSFGPGIGSVNIEKVNYRMYDVIY